MVELLLNLSADEPFIIFVGPRTDTDPQQFPAGFNYKSYQMPGPGCANAEDNKPRGFQFDPNTRYFVLFANATEENVDWEISVMLF